MAGVSEQSALLNTLADAFNRLVQTRALGLADAILQATGRTRADLVHGREGQIGARKKGEVGMHALRLGDVVGEHTAYFCGNGERIAVTHQAHSRDVFARGALRAAAFIARAKPGRYTMADVLGL